MIGRIATGFLAVGFAVIAGCASEAGPADTSTDDLVSDGPGEGASTDEAAPRKGKDLLTASEAVARAQQWADAKLGYCWTPNGGDNHKAGNFVCPQTCDREKNAEWDPYRSDAGGLISWAWKLPAPGRVTTMLAPFKTDISSVIEAEDLRPGDAINSSAHVMLFKTWVEKGKRATFIEAPGCGGDTPYTREITSDVSLSGTTITLRGRKPFTAIRHNDVSSAKAKAGDRDTETAQGTE